MTIKSERPLSLSELIEHKRNTEIIIKHLNSLNYMVNMNINSLKELDRFLDELPDFHANARIPCSPTHTDFENSSSFIESVANLTYRLSHFLGEILVNAYDGKWMIGQKPNKDSVIYVKLKNSVRIAPEEIISRKYIDKSLDSIYDYSMQVMKESGIKTDFVLTQEPKLPLSFIIFLLKFIIIFLKIVLLPLKFLFYIIVAIVCLIYFYLEKIIAVFRKVK